MYVFGWVATILSSIYKLPQIYKLVTTKKSNDISMKSYSIQTLSYALYIIHGFIVHDLPVAVMGIVALIQNILILWLCQRYKE